MHVAPPVAGFLNRYPKTQVNLLLLDRVVDLLEEGVDIAVRIAHLGDSSLIAKPIGSIRQVVCASPSLLDRVGEPDRPEALSNLPCIRFTGISTGSDWEFQDGGKRLPVRVKGGFSCNQVGASLEACVAGVGFGRFFCYQVMPLIQQGKLATVLTEFEPEPMPLSLVYPHARLLSSMVRAMIDWLANSIGGSLDDTSPALTTGICSRC
ncbi:MAG: LysR substrate-binding domain-containing protein [Pseudomonadota bacterium]